MYVGGISVMHGFLLLQGLQTDGCSPDGGTTHKGGWTQPVLQEFLSFAAEKGITVITLWMDSGARSPSTQITKRIGMDLHRPSARVSVKVCEMLTGVQLAFLNHL